MDVLQVVLLAFIQGLTEFLPVSSSAHLLLVSRFTHHPDPTVIFVTALHMGTLLAVLFYFRRELKAMIKDGALSCLGQGQTQYSRLMWALAWGTVPVALAGLLFNQYISDYLRAPLVIAVVMIIFAIFLGIADTRAKKIKDEYHLGWKDILLIGVMQAFALIPGASR
ncbi:MAG TPA: undecaprenyl-diphosphate phosphatase, partial [Gammaproteobacteria bacterium]|nr:undecaprenyl-diphosphate phosphatase [Gammaproteobacteria bacterium]